MINRYVVREKNIHELKSDKQYRFPVIMEQFKISSEQIIEIPSVFNKFTYNLYKKSPISIPKNINTTICQFLNFVREKSILGDDDEFVKLRKTKINGLTFYHLKEFLTYCIDICDNSYSTIKQKEKRLFDFYKLLHSSDLITVKWTYHIGTDKHGNRKRVYQNPLDLVEYHIDYPSKNKSYDKIVDLSDEDIDLLLETCENYVEDILFAIALCMFGGLRKGEVVNLTVNDLRLFDDENVMGVNIQYRPELFEDRLLSDSGVKRKRIQCVFNDNGQLYYYYRKHMKYREKILKQNNTKSEALFIDKNGKALTGSNYIHRFARLKKIFLEKKQTDGYTEFLRLSDNKWGSHICRGIFTNLCIRRGYALSIEHLMALRGDTSTTSSIPYWNRFEMEIQIQRTLNVITSYNKYKDII